MVRTRMFVGLFLASAVFAVLAIGTAARVIRWSLPDQGAMTRFLEETPFDSYPELGNRTIARDGDNKHVCFMCSVYGVTMGYDLSLPESDDARDAFCDRVYSTLVAWQGEERVASGRFFEGDTCVFKVERVRGHSSWTMNVVVGFDPVVRPHVTDPPTLLVGLDDSSFD